MIEYLNWLQLLMDATMRRYVLQSNYGKMQHFTLSRSEERETMEQIRRDLYLNRLIERRENGMIKVVTGIRRCEKSYLLFKLYYQYLIESGMDASRIIPIPLDDDDLGCFWIYWIYVKSIINGGRCDQKSIAFIPGKVDDVKFIEWI